MLHRRLAGKGVVPNEALLKFRTPEGRFDTARFRAAVRIFIIAQEILVDHSSYPTERICRNSHDFRPLGLGYANLGAMIMSLGLPYDSDGGRAIAAAVTAVMTSAAYAASAELASRLGEFPQFRRNRQAMLNVVRMHRQAVDRIAPEHCPAELLRAAAEGWDEALDAGQRLGYRNAQVTVLAPTGTIGFLMDCDTTGVEPDIALVKYKQLAGGGTFKIVNQTVPLALERLGYSRQQIADIVEHIDEHEAIEDSPHLKEEHLAVFDCAFKPINGHRCIPYMGHIRMMAAVQPFLSGAISKTVNMPKEATVEDVTNVYLEGWKLGLKAVAIYRDGSKRTQPVNLKRKEPAAAAEAAETVPAPRRHHLPATRPSIAHKFDVAGHEGYLHVGLYDDGSPGEMFITMAKEGSIIGGMTDAFATAISLCLQYGVPLEALVRKFSHQRFEPSGMTGNPDIPFAKSIIDYIFRWLGMQFLEEGRTAEGPERNGQPAAESTAKKAAEAVREDFTSEPGRVAGAPDTDRTGPRGAFLPGLYAPEGGRVSAAAPSAVEAGRLVRTAEPAGGRMAELMNGRLDRQFSHFMEDAPACDVCGSITVRNGNCYKCYNCGSSQGCS